MLPQWINNKVKCLRQRFDHSEMPETSTCSNTTTSSSSAITTSTSASKTTCSRRSKSLTPKKTEQRNDGHGENVLNYVALKMEAARTYDFIQDGDTETTPCLKCLKRKGKFRGNGCYLNHLLCKYCSYILLLEALTKYYKSNLEGPLAAKCEKCDGEMTAFIRLRSQRRPMEDEPVDENNPNSQSSRVEETISFFSYTETINRGGRVNRAFESSSDSSSL